MFHESKAPTPVWKTTPKQKSFLKILLLVLCLAIFKMMFFNQFIPNKTVSLLSFYLSTILSCCLFFWAFYLKHFGEWLNNPDPKFHFSRPMQFFCWVILLPFCYTALFWIIFCGYIPHFYTYAFGQNSTINTFATGDLVPKRSFCKYQLKLEQSDHLLFEYCLTQHQFKQFQQSDQPTEILLQIKHSKLGMIVGDFKFKQHTNKPD